LKYEEMGINADVARSMIKQGISLSNYNYKIDKNIIANVLVEIPKDIKKRFKLDHKFKKKDFDLVFSAFESKKISKDAIAEILLEIANGKKINLNKYKPTDDLKIEKEIKELVEKNKDISIGGLMGLAMKKYRGKVEGKKISQLINKYKN
jgi:Glu-tRNA(Gln) amidotransferase subunit E-like FAD-binding protein